MDFNRIKDKFLPHVIVLGVIIVLLAIYFAPAFFEGKGLQQHDTIQAMGGAKEGIDFRNETGQEALWTNSMFGGMPLYILNVVYSGDLMIKIMNGIRFLPRPADVVILGFISFYIFLLVLKCGPKLSFIGAFAYAFSSYTIISVEAGHIYKVLAIAYAPLLFAGVVLAFRKKYLLGMGLTALAVSFELASQHYQITYYFGILLGIYGINEFILALKNNTVPSFVKSVAVLLIAALLGLGTNAGRLWAVQEYGKYSIRGNSELTPKTAETANASGLDKDYAFAWSQGIMETFTLLVPDFYGGGSTVELTKNSETYKVLKSNGVPSADIKGFLKSVPTYWGDQPFTSGPVYAGAIICFLFVLGLWIIAPRWKYWILFGTILSIMLAWGKNFESFNYFMFDYFPGYNKFRAVSMAITIALFCMPLLGILAMKKIIEKTEKGTSINEDLAVKVPLVNTKVNAILLAAMILGIPLLGLILFAGTADYVSEVDKQLPEWLISAIREDRKSMLQIDAFRSLFFIAAAATLLYFYVRKKVQTSVMVLSIAALTIFDLWMVDKRYLENDDFSKGTIEEEFQPDVADQMILKDTTLSYRVFNLQNPFNDARTSYFHKSVGGYHGAKMRRYQDVIENHLSQNNIRVLNMLNTKYVKTGDPQNPVQQNPGALGNAWFVNNIKTVNNPDEEIKALNDFEPNETAVVDVSKFAAPKKEYNATGSISLTGYKPNHLTYKSSSTENAFAVFSEIYYPEGWQAYIDGKPVEHIRVNYILRGMEIPAGNHIIEFKFAPESYFIGNKIMLFSSIVVLFIFIAGVVLAVIKKSKVKEETEEEVAV